MFNSFILSIKDKAWQRTGASPVSSNSFCWFAALSGLFFKNKLYANQQNKQDQAA